MYEGFCIQIFKANTWRGQWPFGWISLILEFIWTSVCIIGLAYWLRHSRNKITKLTIIWIYYKFLNSLTHLLKSLLRPTIFPLQTPPEFNLTIDQTGTVFLPRTKPAFSQNCSTFCPKYPAAAKTNTLHKKLSHYWLSNT